MENVRIFLETIPIWLIAAAAAALIVITGLIIRFISTGVFKRNLKKVSQDPESLIIPFKQKYTARSLLRKSGPVEKFALKQGSEIISLLGIDDIWVSSLQSKKRKKDFRRVLAYAPEKGLFQCFLISLEKKSLAPILLKWLEQSKDLLPLRKLALSGIGEPFDGHEAYRIFKEELPGIREMAGDPEWPVRYFAVKILLQDSEGRSERALWDAFEDPHPLVRKTVAIEFNPDKKEKFYKQLLRLTLADPIFEVRQTAWQRIDRDFSDLYDLDPKSLSDDEAFHLLELLPAEGKLEENFALGFLSSSNLELRYAAAGYLSNGGTLKRLCLEVDLGDMEGLERNYGLLEKASQVSITSFLTAVKETNNPAGLLVCAGILAKTGDRAYITTLAKKVFSHFNNQREYMPVYRAVVESIFSRGSEESLKLLDRELYKWRENKELMELLIPSLPERGDFLYIDTLLSFLKDPDFKAKDALRSSLKSMSQPLVLQQVFEILKAGREAYPHTVRMEALKLLAEMGLPYCLQTILENMIVLPVEVAKEYTSILAGFPTHIFKEKVERLLQSPDAKLRASLIAALAATEEREFLKAIRKSLKDADPDVRIASVWSLVEFQDYRSLNQAVSMLRDPIERVRREVAGALGSYGSDESLSSLKEILFEDHEIYTVKAAAIEGLGISPSLSSIDILVERLEQEEELAPAIIQALSRKTGKKEIARLVENFKDASPSLRDKISAVFKEKRESGEPEVVELLKEDIPSLKPFLVEILENTGHVEYKIRQLSHRDPALRRDAAEFLSLVGTKAAFRGIVLAARDPAEEVRVKVIKALEKLETEAGTEMLQALENDPDKKVRRYTLWALERLRAKKL